MLGIKRILTIKYFCFFFLKKNEIDYFKLLTRIGLSLKKLQNFLDGRSSRNFLTVIKISCTLSEERDRNLPLSTTKEPKNTKMEVSNG